MAIFSNYVEWVATQACFCHLPPYSDQLYPKINPLSNYSVNTGLIKAKTLIFDVYTLFH